MAAAYGLYTHIQSNKRRSIALLLGLFFLVYLMLFAGALLAEGITQEASLDWLLRKAWLDLLWASPIASLVTAAWIVIAYFFNQSLIDAVTGGQEVTRR
jgi:heat shock protein HtpX